MYIYSKISDSLSTRLDIARGLAALFVMLGHLRGGFFLAYNSLDVSSQNPFNYIAFFITRTGYECVIVFFVLSGFLVGGSYLSDFMQGKNDIKKYLVNRFSRMYVVLVPALLITIVINMLLIYLDLKEMVQNFNFKSFIGNLFFAQNIFVRSFGGNSPLWSLANEFWYYILWPLVLYFITMKATRVIKIFLILSVSVILYFIAPDVIRLFPLWIIGALLRFIPDTRFIKRKSFGIIAILLFIIMVAYSNIYKNYTGEYGVAISFAMIIAYWMYNKTLINKKIKTWSEKLASFSFSLYAIHYVLLNIIFIFLIRAFDIEIRLKSASFLNWVVYFLTAAFITFICWLFYLISEKHTNTTRKWLYQKVIN